jgi:hypothetical protein
VIFQPFAQSGKRLFPALTQFGIDSGFSERSTRARGDQEKKSLVKYLPDFMRSCSFSGASVRNRIEEKNRP